jgi:hypothetical protein
MDVIVHEWAAVCVARSAAVWCNPLEVQTVRVEAG